MEVRSISQGGQTTQNLPVNTIGSDNSIEVSDVNGIQQGNNSNSDQKINEKDVKNAVDKLNDFLKDDETHAEYSYHDKLKHDLIIKIVDDKTGQVIKEIPPKKILDMIAKMCEMVGILIDKKA